MKIFGSIEQWTISNSDSSFSYTSCKTLGWRSSALFFVAIISAFKFDSHTILVFQAEQLFSVSQTNWPVIVHEMSWWPHTWRGIIDALITIAAQRLKRSETVIIGKGSKYKKECTTRCQSGVSWIVRRKAPIIWLFCYVMPSEAFDRYSEKLYFIWKIRTVATNRLGETEWASELRSQSAWYSDTQLELVNGA